MFNLRDEDKVAFADDVQRAASNTALVDAVRMLYVAFEVQRESRAPRCDASGACCRFDEYGHRLFVTTAELAAFIRSVSAVAGDISDEAGCRYQVEGLCTARELRPFGCRVYFCDPTSTDWQREHFERFQTAIRELHARFDVPYWYAEWRDALAVVMPTAAHERRVARVRLPVVNPKSGI